METADIKTDLGTVRISDSVIAYLARKAVLQDKGVASMDDRYSHAISSVINEKNEGVHVDIKENRIVIDLFINVRHGERIPAAALRLQELVKESVSNSTGLLVSAVNISVEGIIFDEAVKNE